MPANSTDNNVAVNYFYENQAKASEYAGVCVLDEYPWFGRKGMCYDLQVEDPISLVDLPLCVEDRQPAAIRDPLPKFWFFIPNNDKGLLRSPMSQVNHSSNGNKDDSVLIVNDIPEQLSLMDGLLRRAGYAVITAEDGLEAFDVAKRERPDVVISDVSMPRVSGIEFCRLIRQDDELRFIPILLVSAHQKDTESVVEGLKSGADDYLELPFDSSRLIAKVSRLLERSKLETA